MIPRFFRFLVSHAFFAATCAIFLCCQTNLHLGLATDPGLLLFVFCATVASYNFHYCTGAGYRDRWALRYGDWWQLSQFRIFLLFLLLTLFLTFRYRQPLFPLLFSVLLTFSYSLPLLPFAVAVRLRKFGFVKTALLAFVWAWVTVVLPVTGQAVKLLLPFVGLVFLQRFLFLFILCLVFDARDSESDSLAGIHSLATVISPAVIKRILLGTAAILFILHLVLGRFLGMGQQMALQCTLVLTCVVCFLSAKRKSFLFYYLLVDGLMIFSALMCLLAAKCVILQ